MQISGCLSLHTYSSLIVYPANSSYLGLPEHPSLPPQLSETNELCFSSPSLCCSLEIDLTNAKVCASARHGVGTIPGCSE